MPRIARLVVKPEPAAYHVICRSALDGFALWRGDLRTLLGFIGFLAARQRSRIRWQRSRGRDRRSAGWGDQERERWCAGALLHCDSRP